MARADLHVHSTYSEHPSEWFLQRLGAKESYTDPETIYRMARERGMDFVTITDHNRIEGALLLREKYPENTFTGVEFTTYFPEDDCKIHILVYGIDRKQFEDMQDARSNIYNFWRYIMENNIVYSVAHATYSVNGLLRMEHLEKLMLMFDVFEGINGGRNNMNNSTWRNVLSALDEESMRELSSKHSMEPAGRMPWRKSLTGGSDDHAGLFVGQTCTRARASSPEEFLQAIAAQRTVPEGRSNNYQSLVFTVYKIAYEFSRSKPSSASRTFFTSLTEFIFEKKNFKLKERLFLKRLSASGGSRANLYRIINSLIRDVRKNQDRTMEERLEIVYDRIADLSDEFMRSFVNSIKEDVIDGDLVGFVTNASASIPGIFLSIPFFTAVRDMFSNKALLDALKCRYMPEKNGKKSIKVMWFTDTFTDLNGVSVTLTKVSGMANRQNPGFRIVTALSDDEMQKLHLDNVICLPFIESFNLPGYEKYNLKVPSILKALDIIAEYEPDEIFISTPGPIGLTGLLVSRLMSIKATGFYHTDYARQASRIVSDESVNDILEGFIKWFYSCFDEVRVPTEEYIGILRNRGYDMKRMVKFKRGIDTSQFAPVKSDAQALPQLAEKDHSTVMIYTGRVSRDKSLDIAVRAHKRILEKWPQAALVIVGDGPYLEELKKWTADMPSVYFTGRVPNQELPAIYSEADVFLFPSDTDTFGMSVLEAQSCGLPAVVSSVGGPKEIIQDSKTGFVARSGDVQDWTSKIEKILNLMDHSPEDYEEMRRESRRRVLENYDWEHIYDSLFNAGGMEHEVDADYRTRDKIKPERSTSCRSTFSVSG